MKFYTAVEILNTHFGYVEIEKDEDYSDEEIVSLAQDKLSDLFYNEDYETIEKITGVKPKSQQEAEEIINTYMENN